MTDPTVEVTPRRGQDHETSYSRGSNDNLWRAVIGLGYSTVRESSSLNRPVAKRGTTRRLCLSDSRNREKKNPGNEYEYRWSEKDFS